MARTMRIRPRRRLAIVIAVAAVVATAGAAVAGGDQEDQRNWAPIGSGYLPADSRVEVGHGPDWGVVAWRSGRGVCFAITARSGKNWAQGCGPMPDRKHSDPSTSRYMGSMLASFEPAADGRSAMVGAVTNEVFTVDVVFANGCTFRVGTGVAPRGVSPSTRFFLLRERLAPSKRGGFAYRSFVFRDVRGRVLERFAPGGGAGGS